MEHSIKIPSDVRFLSEIEYYLNNLLKDFHIQRKVYCKIYLAVTEAVNNAILHGNKANSDKKVSIEFLNFDEYYFFQIEDEGKGFDFNLIPDPRSPRNLYKESGRGIFIMKEYADKVYFENNGSLVKLRFNK